MVPIEQPIISLAAPIHDAIKQIERLRKGIAIVIDDRGLLAGTVTDGDIRRAILSDMKLDEPVSRAMNPHPMTASVNADRASVLALLSECQLEAVPLVREDGVFVRVAHISDLSEDYDLHGGGEQLKAAVIMAGGEGQRLRPLTEKTPKSMVEIGGMPIVERHVRKLERAGVRKIFISVNYLADVIEDYFLQLDDLDVELSFVREPRKLGTAGALTLLPSLQNGPILIMNADIVHTTDYRNMINFHLESECMITVMVAEQVLQIPYGVIHTKNHRLTEIVEKPSQRYLCNAGIYIMDPSFIQKIPKGKYIDMTDVLILSKSLGFEVAVFPIHEYWADIADIQDLMRIRTDYSQRAVTHVW